MSALTTYSFTLVLEGLDVESDPLMDALFEAGCDDALFGEIDGTQHADFDREAKGLTDAILSAIAAVESTGVRVRRVEPDDLVSAAQIAARLGRSRESVRLLIGGRRGPGNFPRPISGLNSRSPRWSWADVSEWLTRAGITPDAHEDRVIPAINAALELRTSSLPRASLRAIKRLATAGVAGSR